MTRLLTIALFLSTSIGSVAAAQEAGQATELSQVSSATAGAAAPAAPSNAEDASDDDSEPDRLQWGVSVLGMADFIGTGNGDEIIDIPSYGGVGFDVHLGAALASRIGFNGVRFTLLAGYRGNAEFKWGLEVAGIPNETFTQRHQAYVGFAGNRNELLIGGGALFTTLIGGGADTVTGKGGTLLAELRTGFRSGFTFSLGMNVDFYTDLVRSSDGSKVRAINIFFGLGWKTL